MIYHREWNLKTIHIDGKNKRNEIDFSNFKLLQTYTKKRWTIYHIYIKDFGDDFNLQIEETAWTENFTGCFFDFDSMRPISRSSWRSNIRRISRLGKNFGGSENRKGIGKRNCPRRGQLTDLSTWMTPSTNEPARCLPFQPKRRLSVRSSLSPLPYLPLSSSFSCPSASAG